MYVKRKSIKFSLYFLILLILASCSIQKRVYLKGYNITQTSRSHFFKKKEMNSEKVRFDSRNNDKVEYLTYQNSQLNASLNQGIVLDQNSFTFYSKYDPLDSCDIIILKKNAEEIKAKVIEITATSIKYKKCGDPNGKVFLLKKSDAFMVKYPNGQKEVIKDTKEEEKKHESTSTNENGNFIEYSNNDGRRGGSKINGLAVAGFIFCLSGILSFLGLILCAVGLSQIKKYPEKYKGKGLAIAGIIVGIIALVIFVTLAIL